MRMHTPQPINTAPPPYASIQTVYDNQIEVGWVGGTIVENLQTGEKIA